MVLLFMTGRRSMVFREQEVTQATLAITNCNVKWLIGISEEYLSIPAFRTSSCVLRLVTLRKINIATCSILNIQRVWRHFTPRLTAHVQIVRSLNRKVQCSIKNSQDHLFSRQRNAKASLTILTNGSFSFYNKARNKLLRVSQHTPDAHAKQRTDFPPASSLNGDPNFEPSLTSWSLGPSGLIQRITVI